MISQDIFSKEIKDSFLFHIPHSSTRSISSFFMDKSRMYDEIENSTDWNTDKIFDVPGIKKMIYPFHRSICDVERFEMDSMNTIGRGFNYTKDIQGVPLDKKPDITDAFIKDFFYDPWNVLVSREVKSILDKSGTCFILDCHSFNEKYFKGKSVPDVCIGVDSYHTPKFLIDFVESFFRLNNISTQINFPYEGSYVPPTYYNKSDFVKSIMIEINQRMYIRSASTFQEDLERMKGLIRELFEFE